VSRWLIRSSRCWLAAAVSRRDCASEALAARPRRDPATAQQYPDGTVIIRNADGFDLALHPVEHIEPPPAFLHAGFRAAGPADVRALMGRMEADGITIAERNDEAAYTGLQVPGPGWPPDRGVLGAAFAR
jgi:hypothetical protein